MRRLVAAGVVCGLLAVGVPNLIVWLGGRTPVTSDAAKVPHAQAALVLGAQVYRDGRPSVMLADRVTAAAELYKAGRVDKLLLSGDHARPTTTRSARCAGCCSRRASRREDIFTDHAGFDTWDSAQRAKRVFDVSQRRRRHPALPHGARALRRPPRRAEGHGLRRRPARLRPCHGRLGVREAAARVKTLADVVTGADPHFLGAEIPISGDGRVSWGD